MAEWEKRVPYYIHAFNHFEEKRRKNSWEPAHDEFCKIRTPESYFSCLRYYKNKYNFYCVIERFTSNVNLVHRAIPICN